ncbi:MAG TPA: aconitase family protein, partial [Geminicoccaceae bacterium]|nr:aconitase family protein [Geminicoccaceae bacterium]
MASPSFSLSREQIRALPLTLRILRQNALEQPDLIDAADVESAFADWLVRGSSDREIPFRPGRLLMHDTTCTPALVDMAALRDAVAERRGDPLALSPRIPIDVSVDHSLSVDRFAIRTALAENMRLEMKRNAERYRFLKWASAAFEGLRVHPPGTGIMHTINLEQLSRVILRDPATGRYHPDTMLGTDSHTPMVNGIGVLGWGIGGLEAEAALFGLPIVLRIPDVVGVRFTGALAPGVTATDLALLVTERLRRAEVAGAFVEFFGPGIGSLSAGDRAVVANMAPEYGATTGYFPIDDRTLDYLRQTGRPAEQIALIRAGAPALDLWHDPGESPRYSREIEIDLGSVVVSLAGPRRPQDRIATGAARAAIEEALGRPLSDARGGVPDGAVAIAAITSCTNTTDPRLLITAGLLARKARQLGLAPAPWVKTSLAPGSPAARRYLERAGLLDDLAALVFEI